MPVVNVKVREKIAQTTGTPEVVCGNSDYAVVLDLDSEWDEYTAKTMRVTWMDIPTGKIRFTDVPFMGTTAALPVIADAYEIAVGIYAGDIRTTTPAKVPCARCITDGSAVHPAPAPDIYAQLLEVLDAIAHPLGFGVTGDATVIMNGYDLCLVGQVNIYYDHPTLILTITKTRSAQTYCQFAELYFYDENNNRLTPDIMSVSSNARDASTSESIGKCIDGNTSTKWCNIFANPTKLTIELNTDMQPASMSFVTANDLSERDPVSFSLEYIYQHTRKTLLTVNDATITTSRTTETQRFACSYE